MGSRIAARFQYSKLGTIARVFGFSLNELKSLNEFEIEAWLQVAKEMLSSEKQDQKSFLENVSKQLAPSEVRPATINKPNFLM